MCLQAERTRQSPIDKHLTLDTRYALPYFTHSLSLTKAGFWSFIPWEFEVTFLGTERGFLGSEDTGIFGSDCRASSGCGILYVLNQIRRPLRASHMNLESKEGRIVIKRASVRCQTLTLTELAGCRLSPLSLGAEFCSTHVSLAFRRIWKKQSKETKEKKR